MYCTHNAFHRQNGVRYLALSRTIHAGLQLEGPAQSSDHGGPQRFRTGRQPHIHMLLGLGQNEACAQPGRAPPEATQAAPNQPCDEPRRSHAVEVIPAHASAVCGLELAALLAHGAIHAAEVHDHVVAWFGLQCGAAVPEGVGQSTRM
jgi:hypothetical protein